MTHADYARKLEELDSLLNDPDVPMQPERIWSLLADVSGHDARWGMQPASEPAIAGQSG
ncbi:MAG TPA: peptide chain release factor 1 [Acetobacteraceae bacterium]|nr:peptide chain release factor 1 [Acetobacteraceae bacterium]